MSNERKVFSLLPFPLRIRVQRGHEIPWIFYGGIYFSRRCWKLILIDPQGIVLAQLKMLQDLPTKALTLNRGLSTTQEGLLLKVVRGLITILVAYKALINTL